MSVNIARQSFQFFKNRNEDTRKVANVTTVGIEIFEDSQQAAKLCELLVSIVVLFTTYENSVLLHIKSPPQSLNLHLY